MSDSGVERQAEAIVRDLAAHWIRPLPGECLPCFVGRMLDDLGCDETLRFARRYRDQVAPRATALERNLGSRGGFCDCEIFLNAYSLSYRCWTPEREVGDEYGAEIIAAEPPETAPRCAGVRRGSVQPCLNWR